MKVFFYHIDPVCQEYEKWKTGDFPGHLLYGLTHFEQYGIECSFYGKGFNFKMRRFKLMFYNLWQLLFRYDYDILYAVSHRGLELLIFLRALGWYRKPIVIWHHSAVVIPSGRLRRIMSSFFYKGIDKMFFFSNELLEKSVLSGKVRRQNAILVHWGADLSYYSRMRKSTDDRSNRFISTGVENRDFVTLVKALNETRVECDIYTRPFMNKDYLFEVERQIEIKENVNFKIVNKTVPEMAQLTAASSCVLICCLKYPYTVGLTTLVEAMALGLPIIVTDNPTFEMDIEKEGAGLKVGYGDVEGWKYAINYMCSYPEKAKDMGNNARKLAEKQYNLDIFSKEVVNVLFSLCEY